MTNLVFYELYIFYKRFIQSMKRRNYDNMIKDDL